jgi:hypothetical protein
MTGRTVEVDLAGGKVRVRIDAESGLSAPDSGDSSPRGPSAPAGRPISNPLVARDPARSAGTAARSPGDGPRSRWRSWANGRPPPSPSAGWETGAAPARGVGRRAPRRRLPGRQTRHPEIDALAGPSLRHGWRVVADDVVALDAKGRPRPVERPVRIKPVPSPFCPNCGTEDQSCSAPRRMARSRSAGASGRFPARAGAGGAPSSSAAAPARCGCGRRAKAADWPRWRARLEFSASGRPGAGRARRIVRRAPVWRLSGGTLAERCRILSTSVFTEGFRCPEWITMRIS